MRRYVCFAKHVYLLAAPRLASSLHQVHATTPWTMQMHLMSNPLQSKFSSFVYIVFVPTKTFHDQRSATYDMRSDCSFRVTHVRLDFYVQVLKQRWRAASLLHTEGCLRLSSNRDTTYAGRKKWCPLGQFGNTPTSHPASSHFIWFFSNRVLTTIWLTTWS